MQKICFKIPIIDFPALRYNCSRKKNNASKNIHFLPPLDILVRVGFMSEESAVITYIGNMNGGFLPSSLSLYNSESELPLWLTFISVRTRSGTGSCAGLSSSSFCSFFSYSLRVDAEQSGELELNQWRFDTEVNGHQSDSHKEWRIKIEQKVCCEPSLFWMEN